MGYIDVKEKMVERFESFLIERGFYKSWTKLFSIGNERRLLGNKDKVTLPYAQVTAVYKAIKALADNAPQASLEFRNKNNKEKTDSVAIRELLENPNPAMTGMDFLQALVGYFGLHGEIFVLMVPSMGQMAGTRALPAELIPLDPNEVEAVKDSNGSLMKWKVGKMEFLPEEIWHTKDFNPYNKIRGLKPTAVIDNEMNIDWGSLIFNRAFFENKAQAGLALSTDKHLNQSQRDQLRDDLNQRHVGASKAFKTLILPSALKPTTLAISHGDMEYIDQKKYFREEMLGIWRVPKSVLGITDDLNYATAKEQKMLFWEDSLLPLLQKITMGLNKHIVWPFDSTIEAYFDISKIPAFRESIERKIEIGERLLKMGYPLNMVNEKLELGMQEVPWGDEAYTTFNTVPFSQVSTLNQGTLQGADVVTDAKQVKAQPGQKTNRNHQLWLNFMRTHDVISLEFEKMLKTYFNGQRKRALEQVTKGVTKDYIQLDWQSEDIELMKKAKSPIGKGVFAGSEFAIGLGWEVDEELAKLKLRAVAIEKAQLITRINVTIKDQIGIQMSAGIEAGETVEQLSDRVRHIYNMAANRAKTIARTETTAAMNSGSSKYAELGGARFKQWITAGDEAVRESHAAQDGEIVPINGTFSNGMDVPGGVGPADESINCRCTLNFLRDE